MDPHDDEPGAAPELHWPSFFSGGFECSSHRLRDGRRLDLLESTRHRHFAESDYDRLASHGIRCSREGLTWHHVDRGGSFDFASALPLVRAAHRTRTRVAWDLMHFGWPDDLDIFRPSFVDRFAAMARAFATLLGDETGEAPWISPINEISFLAWAGGDVAVFNPFSTGRGFELKCQLARAAIAAIDAIRDVAPGACIVAHEPAFHVVADLAGPAEHDRVEQVRQTQFQATDMLTGQLWPQLGGRPDCIDAIGVNYYPWNQWTSGTPQLPSVLIAQGDGRYRPLADILCEWHARYGKPVYIGETGCEGAARAPWLRYACDAVLEARARGARVEGLCLYPIVNFPGWDDDRHCENGLWDYADDAGERSIDDPLATELLRQQRRLEPPSFRPS